MSDLISRQDAVDAISKIKRTDNWQAAVSMALLDLPSAQPEIHFDEWCTDCKEYDHDKHCCPRFNKAIRRTVEELKAQPKTGKWIYDGDCYICNKCGTAYSWWADSQTSNYCPNCGAMMQKDGDTQ